MKSPSGNRRLRSPGLWRSRKIQSFSPKLITVLTAIIGGIVDIISHHMCARAFLLSMTFFANAYRENPGVFSIDAMIGFVLYPCATFLFFGYVLTYEEKERTLYLLDEFSKDIEKYILDREKMPRVKLLVDALKSYQKQIPSILVLKDFEKRIGQTLLLLGRGSAHDINRLKMLLRKLLTSIKEDKTQSFDEYFKEYVDLLDDIQKSKKEIIDLMPPTRKTRAKTSLNEMVKPILIRVVQTAIILVIFVMIYNLFGITLPFLT